MDLAHLTINTNDLRMSPRSEVTDGILPLLAPLIGSRPPAPIPGMPHLRAEVVRPGHGRAVLRVLGQTGIPAVSAHLVWTQAASDADWPLVVEAARSAGLIAQFLRRPDSIPWLAAMVLPGASAISRQDLMAMGDLERCWAWAVLEAEGIGDTLATP